MKYLIVLAAMIISPLVHAQWGYEAIPFSVAHTFSKMYPEVDIRTVDWDWENNVYEANFEYEEKKNEASFDLQGQWLGSEVKDLPMEELPGEVSNAFKNSEYGDWEINEINSTKKPNQTNYEIEVEKGLKRKELYFDKSGNPIDKEKI